MSTRIIVANPAKKKRKGIATKSKGASNVATTRKRRKTTARKTTAKRNPTGVQTNPKRRKRTRPASSSPVKRRRVHRRTGRRNPTAASTMLTLAAGLGGFALAEAGAKITDKFVFGGKYKDFKDAATKTTLVRGSIFALIWLLVPRFVKNKTVTDNLTLGAFINFAASAYNLLMAGSPTMQALSVPVAYTVDGTAQPTVQAVSTDPNAQQQALPAPTVQNTGTDQNAQNTDQNAGDDQNSNVSGIRSASGRQLMYINI